MNEFICRSSANFSFTVSDAPTGLRCEGQRIAEIGNYCGENLRHWSLQTVPYISHHTDGHYRSSQYIKMILIPKAIGNTCRKRDSVRGCSRWQTQPEKICRWQSTNQFGGQNAKGALLICTLRSADFSQVAKRRIADLCFVICRFSQVVLSPRATSRTSYLLFYFQSFLVLVWFLFSMGKMNFQPYIQLFLFRFLNTIRSHVAPFERGETKSGNFLAGRYEPLAILAPK